MKYLTTILIWFRLGWPIARFVIGMVKDGVVTKAEVSEAVDALMGDDDRIVLWKKRTVRPGSVG